MTLKRLAEDLDAFLAGVKASEPAPSAVAAPAITTIKPGAVKIEASNGRSIDEVVRATFDYVTSQLKEEDGAEAIGQSFMVACDAIAKDAGLDHATVQLHALAFLEGIVEAARGSL